MHRSVVRDSYSSRKRSPAQSGAGLLVVLTKRFYPYRFALSGKLARGW
jgi:hypothetical protein